MLQRARRSCSRLLALLLAPLASEPEPEGPVVGCEASVDAVCWTDDNVVGDPVREIALIPGNDVWRGGAEKEIRQLARRQTAEARLVIKARMVVGVVFEGRSLSGVARGLQVSRVTVRLWIGRYRANGTIEALEDHSRSGRPARLGARDQAVVLELACSKPEDHGRLEARMFQWLIVEEAAKQGVELSRSSVQRIMVLAEVKPYRERYYLFTVKDRPEYIARRDAICAAHTRDYPDDEVLVCMDEKPGIQAFGLPKRVSHGGRRPAAPGIPARIDQN